MSRRRDDDEDDPPEVLPASTPYDIGQDPGIRMLLPVGRSFWAIAAGYLGLFSVLCFPAPLALLAALLAIREMRRDPKKHGMGRAVFGLVMGGIGTACLVLVLIAMAVAAFQGK